MKRLVTLGALAFIPGLLDSAVSRAAVDFKGVFAPQEGIVAGAEYPFRQEQCLNGSWQFQPQALAKEFKPGASPVPELTPPTPGGWESTPIRVPSPWNVNSLHNRSVYTRRRHSLWPVG